jgi:hypothetical protein
MKTEKRADGDGNADGDGGGGVRLPVCVHSSLTLRLSLRFGTLSLCPPALVLPSFALVPAFAHTLAPTLLLVPVMLASTWCGMDALAASCSGLCTHSRTRSAGEARVRVQGPARAHPLPHRLPRYRALRRKGR